MGRGTSKKRRGPGPKPPADERIVLPNANNASIPREYISRLMPGITEPKKIAYLCYLCVLGNRSRAALAAGVNRITAWTWCREDENFNAAYNNCMKVAAELHEDEMFRRASEGVLEPVFQGGQLVGSVRKFSDVLLIFSLKGAMPDKYADRQKVEHEVTITDRLRSARERVLGRKKEK